MHPRTSGAVFAALFALAVPASVFPGEHDKVLEIGKIGQKAPAWKDLAGVDDKRHALDDLKDSKAVVVVFTCNTCPVARDYEERLNKLAKEYQAKGVVLVAINVSNNPGDKLESMKVRAKEKGFAFPYLHDPSRKIAKEYGAAATPHVFLLDKDRNVAYMGAFDDSQKASDVKKHYLRDAVDAVLAGMKPPVTETRPFGCPIKYEKK